jgi:hypothetical protein
MFTIKLEVFQVTFEDVYLTVCVCASFFCSVFFLTNLLIFVFCAI